MVSVNSAKLLFSCSVVQDSFANQWTTALQASQSMGFPRQEYWSELPFPTPGDLSDPGIEPKFPALAGFFFFLQLSHQGSPQLSYPSINRCRDSLFLPTAEENTALEKGVGTEVVEGVPGRWGHGFLGAKEERSRIKMYPATNFQPATHPPTGSHHTQQAGTAITWQVD